MTSMGLAIAMLPAVFGVAGCFDAHGVDPGPWVIDDFEDGDLNPADRNFGMWSCYTSNPANQSCLPGLDSGDQSSTFSLALDFTIVNPGNDPYGGVGVHTNAATAEDVFRFSQLDFSARVSGVPALPTSTQFFAELDCSTVKLADGTSGNAFVSQSFVATSGWQTFPLPMAKFQSPTTLTMQIVGGPAACLRHVDAIYFGLQPLLPDGRSTMGRLNIDAIDFQ